MVNLANPRQSAAIYCRISRDTEGLGLGVARQRLECEDLAKRLGWTVAEVLVDNDMSGYRGRSRPNYRRLLDGLSTGTFDAVITWANDRLTRHPRELEDLIDVLEASSSIVQTVQAGLLDLGTPAGQMIARQLGAVATYESAHKSARAKAKAGADALAGKAAIGGTRGWGYTRALEIVPEEADAIRAVVKLILEDGYGKSPAARWLNNHAHTTPTGGLWRPTTLARALCSARLAGWRSHAPGATAAERLYGGPFVARGDWRPILTRIEVERLRHVLSDVTRRPSRASGTYLLSGLLHHQGCVGDGRLVGAWKNGSPRYKCSPPPPVGTGCGGTTIQTVETDQAVLHALTFHLGEVIHRRREVRDRTAGEEQIGQALAEVARIEQSITALGADLDDGTISRAEWTARRSRLVDQMNVTRDVLVGLEEAQSQEWDDLPDWARDGMDRRAFLKWWGDADIDSRRAVVKREVESIVVHPATRGRNTFDPTRLQVSFRDGTSARRSEVGAGAIGMIGELKFVF